MVQRIDAASFAEIEAEFIERVHRLVWCNVATVDRRGRPRSRILHPIWEGATGWVATRRPTLKAQHLARNPFVSLAYVTDLAKPVYVDCQASWEESLTEKQRIWALLLAAPPPLGYDPAPLFGSPDRDDFGLLKLTPWRIELADLPGSRRVWSAPSAG
jgi:hypothetical protein